MVPAGSSRTPRAFQKNLEILFLRKRWYIPTTFRSGPRKSASKTKRIQNEWMLLHGEIQSPSPGASPSVNRRPLRREIVVSATLIRLPAVRFRVLFHTVTKRFDRGKPLLPAGSSGPHIDVKTEEHECQYYPGEPFCELQVHFHLLVFSSRIISPRE